MAIVELSLAGTTASKADVRIRDKVNEVIRVVNGLTTEPAPAPTPPPVPAPSVRLAIEAALEAAIMAVPQGSVFALVGPSVEIVCRVEAA